MNVRRARELGAQCLVLISHALLAAALLGVPRPASALGDQIFNFVRDWLVPSKQYAVVIGIDEYKYKVDLNYAVNDARTMIQTLRLLGFGIDDDAILLKERGGGGPDISRAVVVETVSRVLKKAGARDQVIVFYAGHGTEISLKDGGKEAYLQPSDYDSDNALGTGLPFRDLVRMAEFADVKVKHVLFVLDACYAGEALKASTIREDSPSAGNVAFYKGLLNEPAYMVLTTGADGQIVKEEDGHGVFTRALVHGLAGAADSNANGVIHFRELVEWLERRVFDDAWPWKQNVVGGRISSGIGQPVFVVPSNEVRTKILNEIGENPSEVTQRMTELCRKRGNDCTAWLGRQRGSRPVRPVVPRTVRVQPLLVPPSATDAQRPIIPCSFCPPVIVLAGNVLPGVAVGLYEVTQREYGRFVVETSWKSEGAAGCSVRRGEDWQFDSEVSWNKGPFPVGDDFPVVCVSRTDARAYARWLRERTGRFYRLPTEFEWRTAASSGVDGLVGLKEIAEAGRANCRDCNGYGTTIVKVGGTPAVVGPL